MPANSRNRKVLLVGSVPLASSKEVFKECAARLGEIIPRIPDGETGVRTMWILCQKDVMARAKNLKMHHQFDIAPGLAQTVYEVADPSKPVEFPALNYAAAAKDSISTICRIEEGRDDCCRHQISGFASDRGSGHVRFYRARIAGFGRKALYRSAKKRAGGNPEIDPPQRAGDPVGRLPRSPLLGRVGTRNFRRPVEGRASSEDRRSRKCGPRRHRSRIPSVLRRPRAQAFVGATGS